MAAIAVYRGRDTRHRAPPAQIPAGAIPLRVTPAVDTVDPWGRSGNTLEHGREMAGRINAYHLAPMNSHADATVLRS
jgi:hypothetical protein